RSVAVVGNADRQSAASLCFIEAGDGERRGAAGGDGDDDVIAADFVLLGKAVSLIDRVLGSLDRTQQRVPAAGNEQQQPLLRPTECRNELRPVLDGEPPGGAGADIDEAAGPTQSFRGGQRRLEKFKAGGPDSCHCRELTLDQRRG